MSLVKILIIDDEETLRKLLKRIVELEGYTVLESQNAKTAFKILEKENVQIVITDVKLPDANGVELTSAIKAQYPFVEIIVLTAYGTIQDGVQAIKNGAFDYLTKGEHQNKIIPLLAKASEKALLQQRVNDLELKLNSRFGFQNIIGNSHTLRNAIDLARKVSATDATVLLLGETGVGKEVFAQAIHYSSLRAQKPIVSLNCSAFSKDLLESELFGHTEGAFTGAARSKKGLIEEAQGGTLFLDEIGEMNEDLQTKLLRVLENGEYYRLGDPKIRKADIRVIAATNRNLEQESETGNFRKDLFYRLSVFVIHLPALRERIDDVELLADHFIRHFTMKTNKRLPHMGVDFLSALKSHAWKGNIRELKNVIERSIILNDSPELNTDLLPFDFSLTELSDTLDLNAVEKAHIRKVLAYTQNNKTKAAKLLGIGLTTLYQKIKDYQL